VCLIYSFLQCNEMSLHINPRSKQPKIAKSHKGIFPLLVHIDGDQKTYIGQFVMIMDFSNLQSDSKRKGYNGSELDMLQ
jgi:hypothetical protein